MLKSMTGFGIASFENDQVAITVEVKSINSKGQDFSFRLPKAFIDKDPELRTVIGQYMERGKVSLIVDFITKGVVKPKLTINPTLFELYAADILKHAEKAGLPLNDALRIITSMPEVYDVDKSDMDTMQYWDLIFKTIIEAVNKCDEFRVAEGNVLKNMLLTCIYKIGALLEQVENQDPNRIKKIKDKMKLKLEELVPIDKIDENRFEQELIFYIEKIDITEEKVRLKSHLDYFIETTEGLEGNGKKLGFIAQEIGREINTLGSKANDSLIQKYVIEMKEELEKIKEQSLNVL